MDEVLQNVLAERYLPPQFLDDPAIPRRVKGNQYAEQSVEQIGQWRQKLADEGSYFGVSNPTIGTGVAQGAIAAGNNAFLDTMALFALHNKQDTNGLGKSAYLDFLRLIETATAPATTLRMEFAIKIGTKDRTPSAGQVQQTPVNYGGSSRASICDVFAFTAANLTVPADVNARVLRGSIMTGLGIINDEYELQCGASNRHGGVSPLAVVRATDPARVVGHAPAVVIRPGEWCVIHMWWLTLTTNVPSWEYDLCWWER